MAAHHIVSFDYKLVRGHGARDAAWVILRLLMFVCLFACLFVSVNLRSAQRWEYSGTRPAAVGLEGKDVNLIESIFRGELKVFNI